MTGKPREAPYIWVTSLAKAMSGEASCLWAPWFKAHHQDTEKVPSDFNTAKWMLEHTSLLTDTRESMDVDGAAVTVEGQNHFHYERNGTILAGKADIVVRKGSEALVIDCKTGQERASHQVQVLIYMHVLPKCIPELAGYTMSGRLVYPHHQVPIPASSVSEKFLASFERFMDILSSTKPAHKAPSFYECRFCDITKSDCPQRVEKKR